MCSLPRTKRTVRGAIFDQRRTSLQITKISKSTECSEILLQPKSRRHLEQVTISRSRSQNCQLLQTITIQVLELGRLKHLLLQPVIFHVQVQVRCSSSAKRSVQTKKKDFTFWLIFGLSPNKTKRNAQRKTDPKSEMTHCF